jgi:hypothetical protein
MILELPFAADRGGGVPPLWADIHAASWCLNPQRKHTTRNEDYRSPRGPRAHL